MRVQGILSPSINQSQGCKQQKSPSFGIYEISMDSGVFARLPKTIRDFFEAQPRFMQFGKLRGFVCVRRPQGGSPLFSKGGDEVVRLGFDKSFRRLRTVVEKNDGTSRKGPSKLVRNLGDPERFLRFLRSTV